jgi:hypothetical protein
MTLTLWLFCFAEPEDAEAFAEHFSGEFLPGTCSKGRGARCLARVLGGQGIAKPPGRRSHSGFMDRFLGRPYVVNPTRLYWFPSWNRSRSSNSGSDVGALAMRYGRGCRGVPGARKG